MQPEQTLPARPAGLMARVPAHWRTPLIQLTATWLVLIALFFGDWRDMVRQWWDSSTYNHILLIPPILGWLAMQRSSETARITPRAWWPGLVVMAGAVFLWVLGDFSGLSLARQLAAVVMLQGAALALLGPRVAAAQLFPLGYMLALVPFGDELIPFLQTITAKLTMVLLAITQIPASIDGVFITTRFGYFEVAEACSGVKFLIAMIAYGALVSNVCFASWWRRAGFMALSVVVPVLANGVRAWGTIYIASWRGIEFAASFDHVFYGWVFFALVMGLVMVVGWRFFDRKVDAPLVDGEAIAASPLLARLERMALPAPAALGAVAALALAGLAWSAAANRIAAPMPAYIALPSVPGWELDATAPKAEWYPLHTGADHRLVARFADGKGHVVDLSFALYAAQGDGKEAGGFGQGALPMGSRWAWEAPGTSFTEAKSDVIQAPGPVHRLAVTWLRTGELLTGSNTRLKLANMEDRLLLRPRATMALILSAEAGDGPSPEDSIRSFLAATGPVAPWMDRMARVR
ncbi:exosortase A [Novosphingobium sediminis]|uniref:Exosortase A n=1 Tax=Novosphingobium sediminis TaxID=707214 RepID=A0A512AGS9_9SPHN|nr:exosortase A [Novosphingobium sediminis]GEN98876.1 exosortase A [Novosphingobium sediminis]